MQRNHQLMQLQKEQLDLFVRKNTDYGEAFATHGPVGVIVRIGDKIGRLTHVTRNKVELVETETLRDTFMDLANYALMAIMLLDDEVQQ